MTCRLRSLIAINIDYLGRVDIRLADHAEDLLEHLVIALRGLDRAVPDARGRILERVSIGKEERQERLALRERLAVLGASGLVPKLERVDELLVHPLRAAMVLDP
jgi:hypothetical protein